MSVVDEVFFEEMNQRNLNRAKKVIARLGEKWLLHPANQVRKKTNSPPIHEAPKFLLRDRHDKE